MATPSTARAWVFAGAALAALCSGCATTPGPDELRIRDIRIEGAKQVDEGKIKKKIVTSEPPWYWPFEVHLFDPIAWQADLRRIERFYEAEGYYQARVVDDEVVPVPPGGVSLRARVSEGEPTHLAEIRIEGLASLTESQRETILEDFPLKEGEVFREEEWEQIKPTFRGRLREMGYAEAVIDGGVEVDVESRLARVLIEAKPGPRYRFGDIFVAVGARPKVPPRLIMNEARLAIPPGGFFSETALAEAQSRVFKMGVFGGVRVTRGAPDREKGTVPVVVDVREAPFRTVRAGGGVGLDQTRNEVRLLVEYTDRNFFGGLRTFTTQVRGGWAFLPNVVAVAAQPGGVLTHNGPLANITAEFTQPRVLHPTLRYFVALEGEWRPELAFTMVGGQAKTGLSWAPNPHLVGQLTYNFESYYFYRGEALLGGRTTELAIGCPRTCFVAYPEVQVQWDRRMRQTVGGLRPDSVDPTQGYYLGLSVQYGQFGGNVRGESQFSQFMRVVPEARAYTSFASDRLTVGARVRAGGLFVSEDSPLDSPIFVRFYAGGGTSMRGYGNRRLSPLQVVPQGPRPVDDPVAAPAGKLGRQVGEVVPIGGERLFEASLEARYRLNSDFTFAVFGDAGFNNRDPAREARDAVLSGREAESLSLPRYFGTYMQYAVGIGLRYATLVGPVRLDLAYRLPVGTPPRVYQTPGWHLLPPPGGGCLFLWNKQGDSGTNPESHCAIHISIGEAF